MKPLHWIPCVLTRINFQNPARSFRSRGCPCHPEDRMTRNAPGVLAIGRRSSDARPDPPKPVESLFEGKPPAPDMKIRHGCDLTESPGQELVSHRPGLARIGLAAKSAQASKLRRWQSHSHSDQMRPLNFPSVFLGHKPPDNANTCGCWRREVPQTPSRQASYLPEWPALPLPLRRGWFWRSQITVRALIRRSAAQWRPIAMRPNR